MLRKMLLLVLISMVTLCWLSAAEYDRIITAMQTLVNANPAYVQLMDIGKNDQNVLIQGIRIQNPNYLEEPTKVPQLVVGAHHGNERTSADLAMNFANKVVAKMKDPNCAEYAKISRSVFYIIPVLNIGGFNSNSRYEKNASGTSIDPNRDYPDPCAGNTYYRLASIRNLAYFVEQNNIVGAITIHGYVGTFTHPWGMYTSNYQTADHALFKTMTAQAVKANGYVSGTHGDIVYPASGSFEDWAYHKFGVWCILMEIKSTSSDLNKDADCFMIYFTLVPDTRSSNHVHPSENCRSDLGRGETEGEGRP